MAKKGWINALFFLLLSAGSGIAFERFVNYSSTLTVNGFAFDGDAVWAATSGGLYEYNRATRSGTLYSSAAFFPDPAIAAVCIDSKKNIWACSQKGYLTRWPPRGAPQVFSSYRAAGWHFTSCVAYGRYIILGSGGGCSVFDTEKGIAVKNASRFGVSHPDPQVNTIAVIDDTLFLGRQQGVARLYIGGNRLDSVIFFDPSIWTVDSLDKSPVHTLLKRPDGSVQAFAVPAAGWNGRILKAVPTGTADTSHGIMYADTTELFRFPSIITSIAAAPWGGCCIGTALDYFFVWNGIDTMRVPIAGPSFSTALRVYADREGCAWVCPRISSLLEGVQNPWWEGISVFRNNAWQLYSPIQYPSMGGITGAVYFTGVVEDQFGRMWFGTPGGQVKRYNRTSDTWLKYCVGAQSYGRGLFFQSVNCLAPDWGKCDAIARDSSGFLWAGLYWGFTGNILCYDPRYEPDPNPPDAASRHFRYFFPQGDPSYAEDVTSICVDAQNNIIAGSSDGKIVVFSHNGNPLRDSVAIAATFTGRGSVFDAAATADGLTYVAAANGFCTYDPADRKLLDGLCVRTWNGTRKVTMVVDSTLKNISSVEFQDERILWLGTVDSGLIRYDLSNTTRSVIGETQGLASNRVNDLSFDRPRGWLWIATDRGVSRYSLGYSLEGAGAGSITVVPNPYSKRRHRDVAFENLPPGSTTCVYTVAGSLVASLQPVENGARGGFCVWKPSPSIVPAVYLYVVRSGSSGKVGRLIVTP